MHCPDARLQSLVWLETPENRKLDDTPVVQKLSILQDMHAVVRMDGRALLLPGAALGTLRTNRQPSQALVNMLQEQGSEIRMMQQDHTLSGLRQRSTASFWKDVSSAFHGDGKGIWWASLLSKMTL